MATVMRRLTGLTPSEVGRSESSDVLLVITLTILPQGAPLTSPMSGNRKNSAARAASRATRGLKGSRSRLPIYDPGAMKPKLLSTCWPAGLST